jgi:RimJ/RimL family protein N-acetyltransferase
MVFKTLTKADCEQVRQWRNQCLFALRTPYGLTEEIQSRFYDDVICSRNSRARFWGIWIGEKFIGMTGLENIEWENSCAEISLILNPEYHEGYGTKAVDMLLDKGFNYLNLQNIYGEVYEINPAVTFWQKIIRKYNAHIAYLPKRKYWDGIYYGSWYFSIDEEDFNGAIYT